MLPGNSSVFSLVFSTRAAARALAPALPRLQPVNTEELSGRAIAKST